MRGLLNLVWLVLSGFWLFLGYVVAGIVLCVPIVTIPWAVAAFRIGAYALWPFGRTVVPKRTSGVWSFLGNVVWLVLAGWWLALLHIVSGVLLCLTVVGIPLGIADFRMVPVALAPLGKEIVPTDHVRMAAYR